MEFRGGPRYELAYQEVRLTVFFLPERSSDVRRCFSPVSDDMIISFDELPLRVRVVFRHASKQGKKWPSLHLMVNNKSLKCFVSRLGSLVRATACSLRSAGRRQHDARRTLDGRYSPSSSRRYVSPLPSRVCLINVLVLQRTLFDSSNGEPTSFLLTSPSQSKRAPAAPRHG